MTRATQFRPSLTLAIVAAFAIVSIMSASAAGEPSNDGTPVRSPTV